MKLSELISVLPFVKEKPEFNLININSIAIDSREVKPGSLFVCVRGLQTDGHFFIDDAIANGVTAIISEEVKDSPIPLILVNDTSTILAKLVNKYYGNPTKDLPVISITGTNGKTTVSYLLENIYSKYNMKTGVIGTIHNKIGGKFSKRVTQPQILSIYNESFIR